MVPKLQLLERCVALLHEVDALQQYALGDSDVRDDNHTMIHELIDEFMVDIEELKGMQ